MQPRVFVHSSDPIKRAGIIALLGASREVTLLEDADRADADVLVLAESVVTEAQLNVIRKMRAEFEREAPLPCLLVTDQFDENDILSAVQSGVVGVLPSVYATQKGLTTAVMMAANGSALLPRPLQTALLRQLHDLRREVLEPNGLTLSGLGLREIDALRLVSEGFRTDEIASKMVCSEGTVKNLLYGAIKRLGLANRTHAVAYAIRSGALA
ncbi:DNA-binding response regulator [Amycolatopsis sp. RM579]|uniref:DNA-binding response regulator n=1 Tax=Amycolatopsis pithecellobii TaxID=664692 RepID=A0A6N7Z7E7_9PSEU|nr:DNA-binding response regulator [Amycolatopsis pithecellobii]